MKKGFWNEVLSGSTGLAYQSPTHEFSEFVIRWNIKRSRSVKKGSRNVVLSGFDRAGVPATDSWIFKIRDRRNKKEPLCEERL